MVSHGKNVLFLDPSLVAKIWIKKLYLYAWRTVSHYVAQPGECICVGLAISRFILII